MPVQITPRPLFSPACRQMACRVMTMSRGAQPKGSSSRRCVSVRQRGMDIDPSDPSSQVLGTPCLINGVASDQLILPYKYCLCFWSCSLLSP